MVINGGTLGTQRMHDKRFFFFFFSSLLLSKLYFPFEALDSLLRSLNITILKAKRPQSNLN